MTLCNEIESKMIIGGKEIMTVQAEIPHGYLKFYAENPRIYSLVCNGDAEPSQKEIEERLRDMEHVNQLVQSIRANGGLIEPIIVRDGDFVVLEGNSRLAAYRRLAEKDPIKWGKVRCTILPSDIDEALIFTLLGQYHIISKKDWSPYEQAGYLWRRNKYYNISSESMSKEMGLSKRQIEQFISVYDYIQKNNDNDPQHWSYYLEFLKSKKIAKIRQSVPRFDEIIATKIKTNEIAAAIDIRNKLEPIAKVPGPKGEKIIKKLVSGQCSLEECFAEAQESGATNNLYQKITKFRTLALEVDTKKEIKNLSIEQRKKYKYELKKIKEAVKKLILVCDE